METGAIFKGEKLGADHGWYKHSLLQSCYGFHNSGTGNSESAVTQENLGFPIVRN